MRKCLYICILIAVVHPIYSGESITGNDSDYLEVCEQAATEQWYFENFRSLNDYTQVVEIRCGNEFANFLRKTASKEVLEKLYEFEKLDKIGNPLTRQFYQGLGNFSGSTLLYIVVAQQIKKLFSLPSNAKIVEIGAGFGGQCYILSHLQSFSEYYIVDLPEVEPLIKKVIGTLQVENVTYSSEEDKTLEDDDIDLVISNYAFSECERQTQIEYFEKVIKKSKRGYVIYNQIAHIFGLDYLSPLEIVSMLQKNNMNPKVHSEPVATAIDNVLIVWDKTLN